MEHLALTTSLRISDFPTSTTPTPEYWATYDWSGANVTTYLYIHAPAFKLDVHNNSNIWIGNKYADVWLYYWNTATDAWVEIADTYQHFGKDVDKYWEINTGTNFTKYCTFWKVKISTETDRLSVYLWLLGLGASHSSMQTASKDDKPVIGVDFTNWPYAKTTNSTYTPLSYPTSGWNFMSETYMAGNKVTDYLSDNLHIQPKYL